MKKFLILSSALILNATTIQDLFNAIKNTPDTKIDNLMIKKSKILKNEVKNSLYPKVSIFMSAEHFNSPVSLKPMPPTITSKITKNNEGYWFSQNIEKVGFLASMPLFVKKIYDNEKKISHLIKANKYKAKLNLLKREALLITTLSKLNYLYSLKNALLQKEKSISTTLEAIKVGVKVGRIPKFKELRLKDALNQIKIKISQIDTSINETKSQIYKLTKINLKKPIKFEVIKNITKKDFLAIKPLKENQIALNYDLKTKKDNFLPNIYLKAQGYRAFGKAYNNNDQLALNLASIGIYLNWTIFDKSTNSQIQKSKIEILKSNLEIQKTLKDLNAEVMKIESNLKEIKKAIKLTQNSIELKEELLKGAKTAFKLNTMTVDEYLQYEDELANAKASLANLIAVKNSLTANLAFIYGNNLERIFK